MSKLNLETRIAALRSFDKLAPNDKAWLLKALSKARLLTPDHANAKTAKSIGHGVLSTIMHLAPSDVSGFNVCPKASQGCRMACLNTAGRGRFETTQLARIQKTLYFVKARREFIEQLCREIRRLELKAELMGLKAVVRLNGTSDLQFELIRIDSAIYGDTISVFEIFPNVQFYDYTKILKRLEPARALPNYHLTFSASESNDHECQQALSMGFNVAMVFDAIPTFYMGAKVINGDAHDLRFLDPKGGHIVGLKAKGKAKTDVSGFVRRIESPIVYKGVK